MHYSLRIKRLALVLIFSFIFFQAVQAQLIQDAQTLAARLAEGGTLTLAEGEFVLEGIELSQETTLIGAGSDKTIIRLGIDGAAFTARNTKLVIQGVAFEHKGSEKGSLALFENSNVELSDCSFSQAPGFGLILQSSTAKVSDCSFSNNGFGLGIVSNGVSTLDTLELSANSEDGLVVGAGAQVSLENSVLNANGNRGVVVSEAAFLRSYQNTISDSGNTGFLIEKTGSATLTSTVITGSAAVGLLLSDDATAWIDNSESNENAVGFGFRLNSKAFLRSSSAQGNTVGFLSMEGATVDLWQTSSFTNAESGYVFGGESIVTVVSASSERNGLHGYFVRESATVNVLRSSASSNTQTGFTLAESSQVFMQDNVATNNEAHGVQVAHETQVELRGSTINSNGGYGLFANQNESISVIVHDNSFNDNVEGDKN